VYIRNTFVHSFVLSGLAVGCWQSFDVPSATASADAYSWSSVLLPSNPGACTVYL